MELIVAINETILGQVEEEDMEAEIADSSEFMDEIDICLTTLEDTMRMEAENVVTPPMQANSSQQDEQVDEPGHGSGDSSKVRLMKLHLPSFDGNFKDWSVFLDSFDSAINSNQLLTPIERFSYLSVALSICSGHY